MIIENERYCTFCEREVSKAHHDEYINVDTKKIDGIISKTNEKIRSSFKKISEKANFKNKNSDGKKQ